MFYKRYNLVSINSVNTICLFSHRLLGGTLNALELKIILTNLLEKTHLLELWLFRTNLKILKTKWKLFY